MNDVPNAHIERLIAGWGVKQVQTKDERDKPKACECDAAKREQDGERKVLAGEGR